MSEPTLKWIRSTYCADNTCVEAATNGDRILLRDSKNPERPALSFSRSEWSAFLDQIQAEKLTTK